MSIENYKAIMLLHALGDTIGFKNGEWEFNFFSHDLSYKTTLEIVFQFISLGGITGIDLKDWNVSDDTLIHIATAKTLLDKDKNKEDIFKKNLIKTLEKIREDEGNQETDENEKITLEKIKKVKFRGVGFTTVTSVEAWNDDKDISYKTSGGNGVAMRTLCVGAYYNKDKDLDKLIKFCIETGRTTHLSPIGYLGGVTSAYFVQMALNKIDIKKWPFLLLELIESDKILSYISSESHDEIIGYRRFISLWKKYIELRFKDKEPIFTKSHTNLIFRTKFFYDFTINYDEFYNEKIKDDSFHLTIGGSGVTCMIMAYDALLDAKDSWEKLVYYSMLHVGDSDTVGAIAGGIFGAMYGFKNVPENMLEYIEKKEELIKLAEEIFENH